MAHVLAQIEASTASEVINQLTTDISSDTIDETREFMFREAVRTYRKQLLENQQINKAPKLQLITRRGNSSEANSRDLLNLFSYVVGDRCTFPKEVLSIASKGVFVEVDSNSQNGSVDAQNMESTIEATINSTSSVVTSPSVVCELYKKLACISSECRSLRAALESEKRQREEEVKLLHEKLHFLEEHLNGVSLSPNVSPPAESSSSNDQLQRKSITAEEDKSSGQPNPHEEEWPSLTPSERGSPVEYIVLDSVEGGSSDSVSLAGNTSKSSNGSESARSSPFSNSESNNTRNESDNDNTTVISDKTIDSRSCSKTYSGVLTEGPWNKPKYLAKRANRRSRAKEAHEAASRNKKVHAQPKPLKGGYRLAGVKPEKTATMYLENISCDPEDSDSDVSNKVRAYARSKKLKVIAAYTVRNWRADDVVGCRIIIPESVVSDVTLPAYWPEGIRCRPWLNKKSRFKSRQRISDPSKNNALRREGNGAANPFSALEYSPVTSSYSDTQPSDPERYSRSDIDKIMERHDWYDIDYDKNLQNEKDFGHYRNDVHEP